MDSKKTIKEINKIIKIKNKFLKENPDYWEKVEDEEYVESLIEQLQDLVDSLAESDVIKTLEMISETGEVSPAGALSTWLSSWC